MPDEKQKLMVLGVLGVVVLGIGAFQLMPSGPSTPAGPKPSGWKPPVAVEQKGPEPVKNPTVVAMLPRRDPFDVPDEYRAKDQIPETVTPAIDSTRTPELPKPVESSERPRRRRPGSLRGRLPLDPFGEDEGPEQLPAASNLKVEREKTNSNAATTVPPVEPPKPPEPTFDYTLSGVIVGRRSAAVLRDKQGNQRLVTAGGMIDGEATLIEVRPGAAIVDVRGKRMRLEVQGDSNAK